MSNSQPKRTLISSSAPSDNHLFSARGSSRLIGSIVARGRQKVCMASGIAADRREMLLGRSGSMKMVSSI